MKDVLFLGLTDGRARPTDAPAGPATQPFTLTEEQRATGMHVIGAPGSGKSKFLEHCIRQDIDEGRGVCLIDPHGELYNNVLSYCAAIRHDRVIIPLNVSVGEHVIGFNPFTAEIGDPHTLVNRAIAACIKAWGLRNTDEMPTLERILRCVFHAIIESGLTIAEAEHLLSYDEHTIRAFLMSRIREPAIRQEWSDLSAGSRREWREEWRSTKNKLLRFLTARPVLRFMALGDSLDIRRIMDEGIVVLVNLQTSEGTLDEMDARLFGAMLVSKFFSVARQRVGLAGADPRPFYLYCDEFQEFVSPDVPKVVAQGRKMGLSLILAHQYLGQLNAEDDRLVEAVMAAVRTRVVFGVESADDAAKLVPSLFRGLIDFDEVKRIDYSVKFWPVYDRDEVRTTGSTHGSGIGTGTQWSPEGDARGEQSNWAMADSEGESVSDVPIYRPVPFLEEKVTPWSLEEQKHRLADVLMMQLQRYCWVKPRDGLARAVQVPVVKPYHLPLNLVVEYEAEQAQKSGAVTPAQADQIRHERTKLLEYQAREFAVTDPVAVHSERDAVPRRKTVKPNPTLRKKTPEGQGGP